MIRMQSLSKQKFDNKKSLNQLNSECIYFITDTQQIYKGDMLYTAGTCLNTEITNNLIDGLNDIQTQLTVYKSIKDVYINLKNNHAIDDAFTTTKNNVNYYINGFNTTITLNNTFTINGTYNEFNNIVFDVKQLENGICTITKNTVFKNCKFILTNSKAFSIQLDPGASVEFINCIFTTDEEQNVLDITNNSLSGFRLTCITNCILPGVVYINSPNVDEVINITYTKGITIDKNNNNQAIVYDMTEPIFNTVELIGGE